MKISSLLLGSVALFGLSLVHAAEKKPNIIFIFTDDQDYKLDSLDYMPNVQKYLVNEGTVYENHYATVAICCPSRVGLLRGQYAHNTNITDVMPPYGGYTRYNKLKLGDQNLPVWLQNAGYNTNFIGKLMNEYTVLNFNSPKPKGFNYQEQLVDPFTYIYNTAVFSVNGNPPVFYPNSYQTDIIHAKTKAAFKRVHNSPDVPYFLWVAPMAPHGLVTFGEDLTVTTSPPVPAERHKDLFKDVKIPRTPHFNPDVHVKTASHWKYFEKINDDIVEELDEAYRDRLRALQAVDELVGTVFEELEQAGELDNTYVFYSSDNGYHLGHHRSFPGKCTNLEEDINVPFIARGPGIPKGQKSSIVSSHHDLAPTFVALAKGQVPDWVDGGVIPLNEELKSHPKPVSKESFAVEFWRDEQYIEYYKYDLPTGPNTYKTLRVIAEDYDYSYAVWCTHEHELYDLKNDPYQLKNLYDEADQNLLNRLDALLVVLKSCRAESCRDPWRVLHPDDDSIQTLQDALDKSLDDYYTQFRKVEFEECLDYLLAANEIPQIGSHFKANITRPTFDVDQIVIKSFVKRKDKTIRTIPQEHLDLLNLIPSPDGVGEELPGEDFENSAVPVPDELLETQVNWIDYGFYEYGN